MTDDRQRTRLDLLFGALDGELSRSQVRAHVVIVGGSALLAHRAIARPTRDVDVVALLVDSELVSSEPLPEQLRAAAERVAENFGLAADWLNGGPTSLMAAGPGLPEGFGRRLVSAFEGEYLRVAVAARIDLVWLKLYALADRCAPRDEADLRALAPTADELLAGARWARSHNMPGEFDDRMQRALAVLGVADHGRTDA